MTDFARARHNMVESQIRTNKVTDERLLSAFNRVPRELFVPAALRGIAYVDEDLKLAPGRYMLEPMVLARLLQTAEVRDTDTLLEVCTGTGYGAAIAAGLAKQVYAIDDDLALVNTARRNLMEVGVRNAEVVLGDPTAGLPVAAPYDVILLAGAVPELPKAIADQLAEGGRLVLVERASGAVTGRAMLYVRRHGAVSGRPVFDAASKPLPGFAKAPAFAF
ncbi:MAG: protein-L-isoaspartate O-methyltransferase [Alphaproteobacteria bacterium]